MSDVITISEGNEQVVHTPWVKMLVKMKGSTGWESYHSKLQSTYRKLSDDGYDAIVAFRRHVERDKPLPHHLEYCTPEEIKRANEHGGHS